MKLQTISFYLLLLSLPLSFGLSACDETDAAEDMDDETTTTMEEEMEDDQITLDNCTESIASDVPAFFADYFKCIEATMSGTDVVITSDGLPPSESGYYATDHPNYVEFDDQGGTRSPNPNEIGDSTFSITIEADPTPKGITITQDMIDGTMGTNDEEYAGGPRGVALDGVSLFSGAAAPGDTLANEVATFDSNEGHPAGTQYHYHGAHPGSLAVLENKGLVTSTNPTEAEIEIYGIMCDGTIVLGCTELDGSTPVLTDTDAQGGHSHDIVDADGNTLFTNRYHVHVCAILDGAADYTPEIQYYESTNCTGMMP